jgi:ribonuclease HII
MSRPDGGARADTVGRVTREVMTTRRTGSTEQRARARRRRRALGHHDASCGVLDLCGVDEVGRGPLAGPVVAAAVILPTGARLPGIDDSKRLAPAQRTELAAAIRACALALGVAAVDPPEIDRLDIRQATLLAMRRAVEALGRQPALVLVDGRETIPGMAVPQQAIIGGDRRSLAIAAASIVAKVWRDALMEELDAAHPGYGLALHKGYGTNEHLAALARLGPSPVHRQSFAPVRRCLQQVLL